VRHLIINIRGKGFDGQPTQDPRQGPVIPGIGVASLRNRVGALGGSLTVSSCPNGGLN